MGDPHPDGYRNVFFELNGQPRDASVRDKSQKAVAEHRPKADAANVQQVGAPMPGMVVTVAVRVGDQVAKGAKLLSLEAMKMETTLYAERDGKVAEVTVQAGSHVETGDLESSAARSVLLRLPACSPAVASLDHCRTKPAVAHGRYFSVFVVTRPRLPRRTAPRKLRCATSSSSAARPSTDRRKESALRARWG